MMEMGGSVDGGQVPGAALPLRRPSKCKYRYPWARSTSALETANVEAFFPSTLAHH